MFYLIISIFTKNVILIVNKIILPILFVVLYSSVYSQETYFNIGYQIGNLGKGVNNMRNEIAYKNALTYPNLSTPISHLDFVHGLNLEIMRSKMEAKSFYLFWNWSNFHLIAKGKGIDPITNADMDIAMKYRHNKITVTGFGFQINNWFGIGYSPVDIGKLVVYYKNSADPLFEKYEDFYDVEKGFLSDYTIYGSSYYLDFFLKNKLRARVGYYKSWSGINLRDRNEITTQNYYGADRFSLSLSYLLQITD